MKRMLLSSLEDKLQMILQEHPSITTLQPIRFERTTDPAHGDFASSIALSTFSLYKSDQQFLADFSSPRMVAEYCVKKLQELLSPAEAESVIQITVAGPGFINISLSPIEFLQAAQLLSQSTFVEASKSSQNCVIEYVSPNTNKPLHIGHLRNAALGSALANILEKSGWNVQRATVNNDRGLHIMKSVWAYLYFGSSAEVDPAETAWQHQLELWSHSSDRWMTPESAPEPRLTKSDHFVGYWYTRADAFAEDEKTQATWAEMLRAWEDESHAAHRNVRTLWKHMNDWFYTGYAQTAHTFGFHFDTHAIRYESELYQEGKKLVLAGAKDGVFTTLPDGAIAAPLEQFNLPNKILLRRDGTGIYMTFDIELTRQRAAENMDRMVWVVGVDQKLYFQQLFAVAGLLGYGKKDVFHHFAYGMVRLPDGKMSSRKGRVIYGDDLIEAATEYAHTVLQEAAVSKSLPQEEKAAIAQSMGVGAIKWTMLAQDPQSEITFDLTESVSIKGFSGPYVQYTAARANSILREAKKSSLTIDFDTLLDLLRGSKYTLNDLEVAVLRNVYTYSDALARSAEEYAPHLLCQYLFTLSQTFNSLYAEHKILAAPENEQLARLCLTQIVAHILQDGLKTLGIDSPERM